MTVLWIVPWPLLLLILWWQSGPTKAQKRERRWFEKWHRLTARSSYPLFYPGSYFKAGLTPEEAAKRHLEKYPPV